MIVEQISSTIFIKNLINTKENTKLSDKYNRRKQIKQKEGALPQESNVFIRYFQ